MVVAAAVEPQSVVMVEGHNVFLVHVCEGGVNAVSESQTFASRHEACHMRLCLDSLAWLDLAVPPWHLLPSACECRAIHHYHTVYYVVAMFRSLCYARLLHFYIIHNLCPVGRD